MTKRRHAGMAAAALVLAVMPALVLASCGRGDETRSADRSVAEDAGFESVAFESSDGVHLEGRLYGGWREVLVVLSHMGNFGDTQADWYETAAALSRAGYGALTYNRRGVCPNEGDGCSEGTDDLAESWRDVVGAYERAREEGARRVVLLGASIGAMSSLKAAAGDDVEVAAVVEVGGINNASGYSFAQGDIAAIEGLKVFASSSGDIYGGGDAAREWYGWAAAPKRLLILGGAEHGTDIFETGGPAADRLAAHILDAVAEAGK